MTGGRKLARFLLINWRDEIFVFVVGWTEIIFYPPFRYEFKEGFFLQVFNSKSFDVNQNNVGLKIARVGENDECRRKTVILGDRKDSFEKNKSG